MTQQPVGLAVVGDPDRVGAQPMPITDFSPAVVGSDETHLVDSVRQEMFHDIWGGLNVVCGLNHVRLRVIRESLFDSSVGGRGESTRWVLQDHVDVTTTKPPCFLPSVSVVGVVDDDHSGRHRLAEVARNGLHQVVRAVPVRDDYRYGIHATRIGSAAERLVAACAVDVNLAATCARSSTRPYDGRPAPRQGRASSMSIDPRVAAVGLLVERESANAIKALKEADVPAILLKGPLQQRWLEPAGPPRASIDVDLLVLREQVEAAETALRARGFLRAVALPDEAGGEHSTLWMAARRVPVELHWSLVGADASRVWPVLSRETEVVVLMGERVEIPNEPARCAIVALHAAQHGIGDAAIFGDLEKALVVAGIESWRRASELATALEGWPPFAGALSLSPRGRDLLDELGSSPPVLGERQALNLLTPAPTSLGFYFLARQPGVRAKAAFVLRKLAPSREFMRLRYPLARRGTLGLSLAYAYRPLWLVRWALPGLRSWHRARRLSRTHD